jgi:hypothetical protein
VPLPRLVPGVFGTLLYDQLAFYETIWKGRQFRFQAWTTHTILGDGKARDVSNSQAGTEQGKWIWIFEDDKGQGYCCTPKLKID